MATIITPVSPKGMHLDVQGFPAAEIVPEALILLTSTQAGFVEGDEPAVRVPFINFDADAGFVAEGANIPEADPDYSEVVIHTGKVAVLARVSREQASQSGASGLISDSMRRSLIRKANAAYLAQPAPTSPATTPPAGLLNLAPTDGGAIGANLDELSDAIMTVEAANGAASYIIAAPSAWASLSKLKVGTASAQSLIGAGVEAAQRQLLGLPVLVSAAMPADKLLVLDKGAVLSAVGVVQLAVSQDAYFTSDSVGVRITWRFGQKLVSTARAVGLTVTPPA